MDDKIILLADDNPDDVKMTLRAFRKANISNEVAVARDGVEALDYLFGTGQYDGGDTGMPQVMLLDLNMPKLGGIEVLARIRSDERTKLLPVVVLTTSGQDEDRIESYRLGANSYVRKPVDFDQFAKAVRQIGIYWLYLNEAPYMRI